MLRNLALGARWARWGRMLALAAVVAMVGVGVAVNTAFAADRRVATNGTDAPTPPSPSSTARRRSAAWW